MGNQGLYTYFVEYSWWVEFYLNPAGLHLFIFITIGQKSLCMFSAPRPIWHVFLLVQAKTTTKQKGHRTKYIPGPAEFCLLLTILVMLSLAYLSYVFQSGSARNVLANIKSVLEKREMCIQLNVLTVGIALQRLVPIFHRGPLMLPRICSARSCCSNCLFCAPKILWCISHKMWEKKDGYCFQTVGFRYLVGLLHSLFTSPGGLGLEHLRIMGL